MLAAATFVTACNDELNPNDINKGNPGDEVRCGDVLAEILHPLDGHVLVQVNAPTDGIIFFAHKKPLVTEHEVIYKIIRRLHQ